MEFSAQVNAMQHLKDQLEQRTRMIQANIQRQQDELRHIQEQLQRVQGQGIQVRPRILLCKMFVGRWLIIYLLDLVYRILSQMGYL